jgi:subtilisin family serine protease
MNRVVVMFLMVLLPFGAVAQAEPAQDKLSPRLKMLSGGRPDQVEIAKQRLHLKSPPGYAEPMVDTLVLFQGNPKAIERYGARVRSVLGNVATVEIPLSGLERASAHPGILRIQEAKKLKPRLDVSVPETGANSVWGNSIRPLAPTWAGNTGRNVIIGVVDTGIDLNHPDFKDSFGKSRVLYVWDQTTGNECTKQQIDAGDCSEKDTEGHGTHVTGIAAGNGSATGHGNPAYRYIGMAPEANLIAVKAVFFETDIIDAIAYIQNKAAVLSLPSVINLSLAGHFGPHDGTSIFETAMDAASGAGKVIVAAAGNEGDSGIHASGTVADGLSETVSFSVPGGSSDVSLDLWYPGADRVGVRVTNPNGVLCPASGFRYPGDVPVTCGQATIMTPATNVVNGDNEIAIQLLGSPVTAGIWTMTLSGSGCGLPPCVTDGRFDVWVDDGSSAAFFTDHFDFSKTIGMPSTATKVIAAASYVTKTCWNSMSGIMYCYASSPAEGNISGFSSLGPRRSCSNSANCPTEQKPDLAAPGQGIMAAFSAAATDSAVKDARRRDPDRVHTLFQGTSMATPHVAGAAALLLAQDATLTSDQVKDALTGNTRTDPFTGGSPNDTWGYGKLAVDLATAGVGTNPPPDPTPDIPAGVAAAAGPGSATISWTGITGDIFLDGYNVYQSASSGGPYVKANAGIVSADSFKVTGLTADTPYYFVVRSVDTPGIESASSAEVTATPTRPPGSVGGGCGMIDPGADKPSDPSAEVSYLLTLFLPLVFIRILQWYRRSVTKSI